MSQTFFTISTITTRVRDILAKAMLKQFWIKAELSSARERGGHLYCNLVETGEGGKVIAQLSCTIWRHNFQKIKKQFSEHQLENAFQDGAMVGLLCQLRFHDQYGLSLEAISADPAVAVGELELKKQILIDELLRLGLDKPNKTKGVSMLPFRIGLITAHNSAAYADFCETLITSSFGFQIIFADSIMQGPNTEHSVLHSMNCLERISPDLDLLVIIRGGGSRIDLSAFDNEKIARRIAGYHFPCWVGIGHETDTSVIDHVSNQSFKTPTAIAVEITGRYTNMANYLEGSRDFLHSSWKLHVNQERLWQNDKFTGLQQDCRKFLEFTVSQLHNQGLSLSHRISRRISDERNQLFEKRAHLKSRNEVLVQGSMLLLNNYRARHQINRFNKIISGESKNLIEKGRVLTSADPATIINRGFAVVQNEEGRAINSIKDAAAGTLLTTKLKDGIFRSKVLNTERKKDG